MAKNYSTLFFVIINCTVVVTNCVMLEARAPNVVWGNVNETENEDYVDVIERGNEIVDAALVPVYDMVKAFLVDIVQQNDLTYMEEKGVDFSDPDSILDSFGNDYEEWIWYAIGKIYIHTLYLEKKVFAFLWKNDSILSFLENISWATGRKKMKLRFIS